MDKSSPLRNRATVGRVLWLLSPWMLVALVILFYPFRFAFELDADEGVNLMKSLLVNQGADLYTDVWSDQPPLLTYLIAVLFQIVGVNLTAVRLMILLFSCALFWAAVQYLRAFWGTPHAIVGGLVLILLPSYLRLSVSVMVGLPAIALAMLSFLAMSYWHKDRRKLWLVLSGLALALSVMTKLFTGLLAPLFIAGLIAQEWRGFRRTGSWRDFLTPGVLWTCGFGITSLLIGLISIYPDGPSQLTVTHWSAQSTEFRDPTTIAEYLSESLPAIFLAVIGSVYVIQQGRLTGLYLMAWALAGFLLLSQYSPVWYHHQLLVTIPVAILAGVAVGEFLIAIRNHFHNLQVVSVRAALCCRCHLDSVFRCFHPVEFDQRTRLPASKPETAACGLTGDRSRGHAGCDAGIRGCNEFHIDRSPDVCHLAWQARSSGSRRADRKTTSHGRAISGRDHLRHREIPTRTGRAGPIRASAS